MHLCGPYKSGYPSDSMLAERGSVARLSETSQHDLPANEEVDEEAIATCHGEEQFQDGFPDMPALPRPENQLSQMEEYTMATKERVGRGRHRRNPATTDIVAPREPISAVPSPERERANADTPILSPSPISPAKQLRVTNSIPQLMKALPPLPDEALKAESAHKASPTATEVSTGLLYSSPANIAAPIESEPNASTMALKSFFYDETIEPCPHQQLRGNPSRFKVRLRSSHSTGFQREGDGSSAVPKRSSSTPIKPRLRLKVSRNKMSQKPLAHDGTVIRNANLGHFNSLLELKYFPQKETLTERSSFGEALEEQLAQLGIGENRLSSIDESTKRGRHHPSDQFDITYPVSHRGIAIATPVPQRNPESEPGISRPQASSGRSRNSKVLGTKVSFLRPRTAPRARIRKRRRVSAVNGSDPTPLRPSAGHYSSFDESGIGSSPASAALQQKTHNKARRVRRWASEAKRAVRSYVRKTLNRPWHSED